MVCEPHIGHCSEDGNSGHSCDERLWNLDMFLRVRLYDALHRSTDGWRKNDQRCMSFQNDGSMNENLRRAQR